VFAFGKAAQHRHRVIADRREAESALADTLAILFQLHELGFAVRSPVGRPEENQQRAFWAHDGFERLNLSVLVGQGKAGNAAPRLGAGLGRLRRQCRRPREEYDRSHLP